jgi:hypothetical protein
MIAKGDATSALAAPQLAALVEQPVDDASRTLRSLLRALLPLLCDAKWDVRSAAACALSAVASAATVRSVAPRAIALVDVKSVAAFELARVLAAGPLLLKAAGPSVVPVPAPVVDTTGMSAAKARMTLERAKKAAKLASVVPVASATKRKDPSVADNDNDDDDDDDDKDDDWPFLSFVLQLRSRLCDPRWEWRHGAAIALRALIAARPTDAALRHLADDLLARVLVVMATDRFADMQGDAFVAPVRAATALLVREIVSMPSADAPLLTRMIDKLASLVAHSDWRVQHGGFLALKFICASSVKPSAAQQQQLLAIAIRSLGSPSEDVASEAAETLFALAPQLSAPQCAEVWTRIELLLARFGRHDSSVASASMLQLLAEVIHANAALHGSPLGVDVSLLWPFLMHNIAAVRDAALDAVHRLVESNRTSLDACASDAMRHTFQALFFATHDAHAERALALWGVVHRAGPDQQLVDTWLALMATPVGAEIDKQHVCIVASPKSVSASRLPGDDDDNDNAHASEPIVVVAARSAGAVRYTRLLQCADAFSRVRCPFARLQPLLQSPARAVALLLVGWRGVPAGVALTASHWLAARALGAADGATLQLFVALFEDARERPWHRFAAQTLARLMLVGDSALFDAAMQWMCGKLTPPAGEPLSLLARDAALRVYDTADEVAGDADESLSAAQRCACIAMASVLQALAGDERLTECVGQCDGVPARLVLLSAIATLAPRQLAERVVQPHLAAVSKLLCAGANQVLVASALASVCAALPTLAAGTFVSTVLSALHDSDAVDARLGGALCVRELLRLLDVDAAPYVALFAPAMLACMSDSDARVREASALCFAQLVRLMPVESTAQANEKACAWFSAAVLDEREKRRAFVTQLLDGSSLLPYEIPAGVVTATLRSYQQHGVNWLAFLRQYGLHGILCDDMGLGKTLQTLCMLAADRYEHERYLESPPPGALDDRARLFGGGGGGGGVVAPSIIVCPTTLQRHWANECEEFCRSVLRPLVLDGNPLERARAVERLFAKNAAHNVVIVSYGQLAALHKDDVLARCQFRYAVLDEGHLIKNNDTLAAKAAKALRARCRLILSGTPVQNNVLELWSLFDFLMPGFLGTKQDFNAKYERPIQAMRGGRAKSAQAAAAARALQALHRQVLPFVLRRLKADVLTELPAKIIQDVECDASELQKLLIRRLAELVPSSHELARQSMERKICNHPKLALSDAAQREAFKADLARLDPLDALDHAPKLRALLDLLQQCGIGVPVDDGGDGGGGAAAHRVLIFALTNESLDLIEELLRKRLPACVSVRLESGKKASELQSLVTRFNRDPTIDVMLLLTDMGAHGLNLTGADTVIFFEHHWNPAVDDQASNRPHRIGQKRVVTVYRLITRDTIEQRIHGLQQFKLKIANAVVNAENSNVAVDLNTNQLLDLYPTASSAAAASSSAGGARQAPSALDPTRGASEMVQLESESQYDEFSVKRARK